MKQPRCDRILRQRYVFMSIQKIDHVGLIDLILAACICERNRMNWIFLNPDQIQFILVRVHFNSFSRLSNEKNRLSSILE